MNVAVTFYSSTPDQTDSTPFITANGTVVRDGIAASNFLAFGTRIKLPELFSDKQFVIEDRMHSRFTDRVDVWVPTQEEALNQGISFTTVEIY
jgi:3D (Asp-Asp-Asp) domain-containing protein